MLKAMGMVVGVFSMGAVGTFMLAPLLGAYSEHASLAAVGIGLVITSQALGSRLTAGQQPASIRRELRAQG